MESLVVFGTEDDPGLAGEFADCLDFGLNHGVVEQKHCFGVGMFEGCLFLGYLKLTLLYQISLDQIDTIGSLTSDQCHLNLFLK
jgi:hypothetical protein